MGSEGRCRLFVPSMIALLSISFSVALHIDSLAVAGSLDTLLERFAFKALTDLRLHTGDLYKATAALPSNFSGIQISVVRLRSLKFWTRGANFSSFTIPPRTRLVPHVRRIAIVYHDLGNWSTRYYSFPGYRLLTSVIGFSIYDASNSSMMGAKKLDFDTEGKPMRIRFPSLGLSNGRRKCAAFDANGGVSLSEMSSPNMCYGRNQGHFSVVSVEGKHKSEGDDWRKILILVGSSGVVLVCIVGVLIVRAFYETGRVEEMKIQAEEEEEEEEVGIEMMWIGSRKMPSATVTRTQPILESGHVP